MKRIVTLAAFTAIAGLLGAGLFADEAKREDKKPAGRLAIGGAPPAAKTEMESVDGKKYSIDGVAGQQGTLVIFTCNHCPVVKKWEDRIAAIGNEYKKKGFGVILVNSNDVESHPDDSLDAMKERAKKLKLEVPYVMDADSSVARAFGASKTPEVFLFDKTKKLAYWGAVDDNADNAADVKQHYLKNAMDALAAGKTPDPQETKALGCAIKLRKAKDA